MKGTYGAVKLIMLKMYSGSESESGLDPKFAQDLSIFRSHRYAVFLTSFVFVKHELYNELYNLTAI